jgi:hypothetical protein
MALTTILLIAGGAALAAGAIEQGQAAKREGKASKKLAEFNARQLEREAKSTQEAAGFEAERIAKAEKISLGALIARGGKSGVTLEGSPIAVLADTAATFAIDRALTLRAGLLGQKTLGTQAGIQRRQGQIAKAKGKAIKRASLLQAGGTLATTFGAAGLSAGGPGISSSPAPGPSAGFGGTPTHTGGFLA